MVYVVEIFKVFDIEMVLFYEEDMRYEIVSDCCGLLLVFLFFWKIGLFLDKRKDIFNM